MCLHAFQPGCRSAAAAAEFIAARSTQSTDGETALMFAAIEGQARVVQLLIDAGEQGRGEQVPPLVAAMLCQCGMDAIDMCVCAHVCVCVCVCVRACVSTMLVSVLVLQAPIWTCWTTTITQRWRLQWRAGTRRWCRRARCCCWHACCAALHNAALQLLAVSGEEPARTLQSRVQVQFGYRSNRKMPPAARQLGAEHAP